MTRVRFLDLSRQTESVREEVRRRLDVTFDASSFILGDAVDEFERSFASSCGAAHAVGVASGTDALAIALAAVGVQPGDEVVTAANTCLPTVVAIERAGATPVLADVEPDTMALAADSVERALTPRTRAIVPVHLYGQCASMAPLVDLARVHRLKIVEDAAHAHGAEYDGRVAGSLGDAAAFSFYPTKNLGALGDGGAVVTNDAEVAEQARAARAYRPHASRPMLAQAGSSRLDALQAAVLLAKLPHLARWNERRRTLAARYRDALDGSGLVLPVEVSGRRHVFHLFVVRTAERDALRARLVERGVETLVHYAPAVHEHSAYADLARPGLLRESERCARQVLSLPLYPELRDDELDTVIEAAVE
jgi:dTDP-4-amino-4,6-dideoxygalactose transaminase